MLKEYAQLIKISFIPIASLAFISGVIAGGFQQNAFVELTTTLIGVLCVTVSSSVFNNYIDRNIDKKMERTKHRPLVTGAISERNALILGSLLAIIGFSLTILFGGLLVTLLTATTIFMYDVVYSIAKRRLAYGSLFGSIPMSIVVLIGYVATTHTLDSRGWILFAVVALCFLIQYYLIMQRRRNDYVKAQLPVPANNHTNARH